LIVLDRIPVFISVVENLSFSQAAEKLGRTQSAVSQSIALLEEELETQLFIRDGKKIRLTEPGKQFYNQALLSLNHIDLALEEIRVWKGLERGTLTIGSSHTSATLLLTPLLDAFHKRYPGIFLKVLQVLSQDAPMALKQGKIDLTLGILPRKKIPGLYEIPLMEREDLLIASVPLFPLEHDPHYEKLLSSRPFVIAGPGMQSRMRTDQLFEQWNRTPRIVLECDDIHLIKQTVMAGLGVSLLPEIVVREEIKRGKLFGLSLKHWKPINMIGLLTLPDSMNFPAVKAFIELLQTSLQPEK